MIHLLFPSLIWDSAILRHFCGVFMCLVVCGVVMVCCYSMPAFAYSILLNGSDGVLGDSRSFTRFGPVSDLSRGGLFVFSGFDKNSLVCFVGFVLDYRSVVSSPPSTLHEQRVCGTLPRREGSVVELPSRYWHLSLAWCSQPCVKLDRIRYALEAPSGLRFSCVCPASLVGCGCGLLSRYL